MTLGRSSEGIWSDLRIHLAIGFPFLALVAPFTIYLTYRKYPLMSTQVWLILAGMFCVSALIGWLRRVGGTRMYAVIVGSFLTFAGDYLFEWVAHARNITCLIIFCVLVALVWRFEKATTLAGTAFLCVFVMSTLLRNGFEREPRLSLASQDTNTTMTDGPPRLIHLILDEHHGIEGIPSDTDYARKLKHKIKQFYQRHGFKLYGGAYSHYFQTVDSIPNLVNFSAEGVSKKFVRGERPPYTLQQNGYFQFLQREGYRIHVVDGNYVDFCSSQDARPQSCFKYQWYTLDEVAKLDLPTLTKTTTLLATFVSRYTRYQDILRRYELRWGPFLLSRGVAIPVINRESLWTRRPLHPFSVNAMAAMDAVSAKIVHLSPGHMLFAHLFLPHFPYVFREDCSVRTIPESLDNMEAVPIEARTTESRGIRFDQYLRQVECLYAELDELFRMMQSSGVFSDSIVIVQGDHGARLGLRHPTLKEQDQLTAADYADGLSTLFAAKVPGKPGGYDPSLHAIDELLVQTLDSAFDRSPELSVPRQEPFAYLSAGGRKEQLLVEMPWRPSNLPYSTTVGH
jgi:hypothetical protein